MKNIESSIGMKCIILGASGLVGQQLLRQALANPLMTKVIAPSRTKLPQHPKLENPIVDFANLPADAAWWSVDIVLCALGTTMKLAGSKERFFEIDHDYVMNAARLAQCAGTTVFVYNSSLGAHPKSGSYYLQVKGKLETDLEELGFRSLSIVRPSFLDGGPRAEKRPGETVAIALAKLCEPLLPKRYRAVSTSKVASMMWALGMKQDVGVNVVESDVIYSQAELK